MSAPTTSADAFVRHIDGSRGTLAFGNGVPALTGALYAVADDVVQIETDDGEMCVVPVSAIVYWRFSSDD